MGQYVCCVLIMLVWIRISGAETNGERFLYSKNREVEHRINNYLITFNTCLHHRSQENLVRPSCLTFSLGACCTGSLPSNSYTPPLLPSFKLLPSNSGGSQPPLISTLGCTLLPCTSCDCHPYFSFPVGISLSAASESLGNSSFTAASASTGG